MVNAAPAEITKTRMYSRLTHAPGRARVSL